ncbi:MAG: hypothetical protein AMJ54_07220 [Deltaproteobacteria bacterium SG8_13]|nr:MAG: hypothetical protein AMJ54_07220 [Deltaproteobacteria bacterium SG8_13]
MSILNEYGTAGFQRGVNRVRLAVLKLAAGDLGALCREIDVAKKDYHDVLASAEYPGYMQKIPPSADLAEAERERIIRADWTQDQTWLNGKQDERSK